MERLKTIDWIDSTCVIIDQTALPISLKYLQIRTVEAMYDAIKKLKVRGAPAIGIAGAFGCYIAVKDFNENRSVEAMITLLEQKGEYLIGCRPTAINLQWAVRRIIEEARKYTADTTVRELKQRILQCAQVILEEDREMGYAIGKHGVQLLENVQTLLTHCNAGGLATAEYGTALAPVYVAAEYGKTFTVYADETRPLLQGSRITAFELQHAGIPVVVICDNMAASVMRRGLIDAVIVGADRITANGDTANKIGTYGLALIARAHDIPFYVAAPSTTFDLLLRTGDQIPIEERDAEEICCKFGTRTAPNDVAVYNPAFDVTPAELVTAFITERGIIYPPFSTAISELIG